MNYIRLLGTKNSLRHLVPARLFNGCPFSISNPANRVVLDWDRGGLLGWKKDEWRKQAVGLSLLPPEKRPRTKDDDEDEEDWDMTLNTYKAWANLSWPFGLPERAPDQTHKKQTRSSYLHRARNR